MESQSPGPQFKAFIQEYGERAFQFAYRLGGNAEEAKELVQEAFFRMYRHWDRFDQDRPMSAWYFKILRNLFLDGCRRYERRKGVSLDRTVPGVSEDVGTYADALPDYTETSLELLARQEKADEVRSVLDGLSYEHRAILSLVDMEGASYLDVERVLEIPLGTVRSRIARARTAFRKSFEQARRSEA